MKFGTNKYMNIVCVSHLRWDFVWQRPQHLLNRAAKDGRVLYVEEPVFGGGARGLEAPPATAVMVARPPLPRGLSAAAVIDAQRRLLTTAVRRHVGDAFA